MCLHSKTNKPKIATEPIKVYKLLFFDGYTYETIVQCVEMEEGEQYTSELGVSPFKNEYSVEQGLHSYVSLEDARYSFFGYSVIVEMEIPKGSEYFEGDMGDIASNNLVWNKGAKIYDYENKNFDLPYLIWVGLTILSGLSIIIIYLINN